MTDQEEWDNLKRPLGEPGSGLVRYAAAMHLRQRGLLDDETLERYRICSRLDWEDPDTVCLTLGHATSRTVVSRDDG
ncbi:MAG: hypothetical protein AAF317_15785 [Pseudomonadota bacterium]